MKFTIFIDGDSRKIDLQESIVTTNYSYLYIKKAYVYWEYKNVKLNNTLACTIGTTKYNINTGYWSFKMLKTFLESVNVKLEMVENNGTCKITNNNNEVLVLSDTLIKMLGFNDTIKTIKKGIIQNSISKVDINRGLNYIQISSNIVNSSYNYNPEGKKSNIALTLPVITIQSLFGTVYEYNDIESKVTIIKGAFNELIFKILDQDGNPVNVGSILLECYLE